MADLSALDRLTYLAREVVLTLGDEDRLCKVAKLALAQLDSPDEAADYSLSAQCSRWRARTENARKALRDALTTLELTRDGLEKHCPVTQAFSPDDYAAGCAEAEAVILNALSYDGDEAAADEPNEDEQPPGCAMCGEPGKTNDADLCAACVARDEAYESEGE